MRSIARDLGERFGCGAFVADLRRTAVGTVLIEDCVSLDLFEQDPRAALIDPLELLDVRCAFIDDARIVARIDNGNALDAERIELHPRSIASEEAAASPATQAAASPVPCFEGEVVALIVDNRIKALYSYDAGKARFVPKCVFPVGVERGSDLSYR